MKVGFLKRLLIVAVGASLITANSSVVLADVENGPDAAGTPSAKNTDEDGDIEENISCMANDAERGSVSVSAPCAETGEEVTVTAEPAEGYYLAQVRYEYKDEEEEIYELATKGEDGSYSFIMPSGEVTVIADFISVVWDGTIDITWYDPDEDVYEIRYPAQLAGAAALDNGLFNDYPMKETVTEDGAQYESPYLDIVEGAQPYPSDALAVSGLPHGYNESYYNVFSVSENASSQTTVVGDITYLVATRYSGSSDGGNGEDLETTGDYWTGPEDFNGKTIRLTADLDMGGNDADVPLVLEKWSGPNYMPIGGQYSMKVDNGYTKLSSSFNGTFDGQGHIVYHIYCNRYGVQYGDSQSVGLIGRLGCHDSDPVELRADVLVKNVAVDGIIYGRRSVGGIVGKIGRNKSARIDSCINFAAVQNTDAKGCGGITGAGWNSAEITNCVNFGYIYAGRSNAGGISGSCESTVQNCYNLGYVGAITANQSQAFGTNNGFAVWRNCYYLADSSMSEEYPAVYKPTAADTIYEVEDAGYFKTPQFLKDINGDGRAWVLSVQGDAISENLEHSLSNICGYTSSLKTYDATGAAIPRTFVISESAEVESFSCEGEPCLDYVEGQTFNADSLKIFANYSDGSREAVSDYEVVYENGGNAFAVGETKVTLNVERGEQTKTYEYEISVTKNRLENIQVTREPYNTIYNVGASFNPEGMIVKVTYLDGRTVTISDYTWSPVGGLTEDVTDIVISYTDLDSTVETTLPVKVGGSAVPEMEDGVAQIENPYNLLWFSNQLSQGVQMDAVLKDDIDLTGENFIPIGYNSSGSVYYTGKFDGNEKTITLDYSGGTYSALFAGIESGAEIKNVTVEGQISGTTYTAGIVSRASGGVIKNCTSHVNLNGGSYVGGIAGYVMGGTEIIGCMNYGAITGTYQLGGIAGVLYETNTVQNCGNEGALTTNSSSVTYCVGGIIGDMSSASIIDSCYNTGNISSTINAAGGIAGNVGAAGASITNCYNSGSITCQAEGYNTSNGGIVGYVKSSITIRNCYNAGEISGASYNNVGALIGYRVPGSAAGIYGNYALCGTAAVLNKGADLTEDTQAKFVTVDQLKTMAEESGGHSMLGTAYKTGFPARNGGYPLLAWQELTANDIVNAINAIGTVTADSKDMLGLVRNTYNALSEEEKKLVTNLETLEKAETAYRALAESQTQNQTQTQNPSVQEPVQQNTPPGKTESKVSVKKITVKSAKNSKSKKVVVKWKKVSGVNGYQIRYSTNKNFKKSVKIIKIANKTKTSRTITKLKKGKTYYIQVCAYKKVSGKTYCGAWSKKQKVKIRK